MSDLLPRGWIWCTIGDISDVNPRGYDIEPEDEEPLSFIPMAAVEEESGRLDATTSRAWSEVRKGYSRFQEGDVLFAKITPCMENGKAAMAVGLVKGRGAGSTEFHVIRPAQRISGKYILHFVLQREFRSRARMAMRGAAGQLRVPAQEVESARLPLAPPEEQQRIVEEIEKQFTRLDAAVAALERVRAKLKRYRASVLKAACEGRLVPTEAELARAEGRDYEPADQLLERILAERRSRWEEDQLAKIPAKGKLPGGDRWKAKYREPLDPSSRSHRVIPEGWVAATFDQLGSLVTSGSRGWAKFYADTGCIFVRAQNLKSDTLSLTDVARVRIPAGSEGERTQIRKWDLLITITGANVTKSALVTRELGEAYVSQHVGMVRFLSAAMARYLYLFTVCPTQGRRALTRAAYGMGKPGLNLDDLRELQVPIPPLAEQQRIVEEVEKVLTIIDTLDQDANHNLHRAQRLRQSILKRAFEGKLVPQDPNDEPASVLLDRVRSERAAQTSKTRSTTKRRAIA